MTASEARGWRVLDSHAVLALLMDEPGADIVRDLLREASPEPPHLVMSVVNLGEVFYRLMRVHGATAAERFLAEFEALPVTLFEVDWALARHAAELKAAHPIAFADCIAAALAIRLEAPLVTGDPEFRRVQHLLEVHWLPR